MLIVKKAAQIVWPRWASTPSHKPGARSQPAANTLIGTLDMVVRLSLIAALAIWVAASHQDPTDADRDAARRGEDAAGASRAVAPAKETMVAFYGGVPYTYPSRVTVRKDGVHDFSAEPVEWRAEPFKSPIYYGVRIVNWFTGGRTGAMLDFTHSKAISELDRDVRFEGIIDGKPAPETARLGDVFRRLEASHGHNMLTLNGLVRLFDLAPRLSLYGGLGAGINLPHAEIQMQKGGPRTYEYLYTGPAAQALVGFEFRMPRMSYFFEYKFTFAQYDVPLSELDGTKIGLFADLYRQAQSWWSGEPPPGGMLSKRLVSHQAIGGLGVRIGGGAATAGP